MKPTTPFANNIGRRYRADGRIVARRPILIGAREVQIGEDIPESEFEPRRRWQLWEQGWIDTPEPEEPSDAELERLTAPDSAQVAFKATPGESVTVPPPPVRGPQQGKQQQARR